MPHDFYTGSDWEQSSGPIISRNVHPDDCWPHGLAAGKDVLADGLHPVLAIGGQTLADGRPFNCVGVIMTYNAAAERAVFNVAPMVVVRQYVANILVHPDTYEQAPNLGMPVYVDDSAALSAGVTLSLAAINDAGLPNPHAGWLWYCQDEDEDVGIGGVNVDAWPKAWPNELTESKVCVMIMPGMHDILVARE